MKKTFFYRGTFLFLGALALSSCWNQDEDELMVFVPNGETAVNYSSYQERVDAVNKQMASYMKQVAEHMKTDKNNPENMVPKSLIPTEFEKVGDGYVGVVDLGLSVKWAACNLGTPLLEDKDVKTFEEFLGIPEKLTSRSAPSESGGTLIPLNEYNRGTESSEIKSNNVEQLIAEYESQVESYRANVNENLRNYYQYLWDTKYAFVKNQSYVMYGSNQLMKRGDTPVSNPPAQLSGAANDAATNLWGDDWHTPTFEEMKQLYEECSWQLVSINGENGCVVTGPNGNKMYLPADGYMGSKWRRTNYLMGYYITSTLAETNLPFTLRFSSTGVLIFVTDFENGYCVRPVKK